MSSTTNGVETPDGQKPSKFQCMTQQEMVVALRDGVPVDETDKKVLAYLLERGLQYQAYCNAVRHIKSPEY